MSIEQIMALADAYASQLQVCNFDDADKARDALEAAIVNQQLTVEQGEPVAKHVCNLWVDPDTLEYIVDRCDHPPSECIPVHTRPAPVNAQEVRLWDSQWVNVVNHDNAYRDWSKEDAINHAVKMTEKLIAENVNGNKLPPAPVNQRIAELEALNEDLYRQGVGFIARIAELEAALDVAHGVLEQIQRMGYSDVGDKMMVDEAIAKLKEVRK